jgi:lipopolysaccharide biosynthesis regulator YciM
MAVHFLSQQLKSSSSLKNLLHLTELYLLDAKDDMQNRLEVLKGSLEKLLMDKSAYRCSHCGFPSSALDWFCPSCHHWSTVKPIPK